MKLASITLAALLAAPITAFGFGFNFNFDSITADPDNAEHLRLQLTQEGQTYTVIDDDGLATILALDHMLFWQRQNRLTKGAGNIDLQPAEGIQVARPALVKQLKRLAKNMDAWTNGASAEVTAVYQERIAAVNRWIKIIEGRPTNSDMGKFTDYIHQIAKDHSYKMAFPENPNTFVPGQTLMDSEANPLSKHFEDIWSRCAAETTGDFAKLAGAASTLGGTTGGTTDETQGTD